MRSSTIAAAATAGLIAAGALTTLPSKLIDQRPASIIWQSDGGSAAALALQTRLVDRCRGRSDHRACADKSNAAFNAIMTPIRAEFDRCIAGSWVKSRCMESAKMAIASADTSSVVAELDATAARQRAAAESKRQTTLEDERRQSAEVMGTDDGRTYLRAAYEQRFNAAHRECYDHPGLLRLMRLHFDANPEDFRVREHVREACQSIMRKQPFVMRPDGRNSILGYPLPPFEQVDHWLRSRCVQQGREAWRCIKQAAEGLLNMPASWRELDHETSTILRSLGIFEPSIGRSLLPCFRDFGRGCGSIGL